MTKKTEQRQTEDSEFESLDAESGDISSLALVDGLVASSRAAHFQLLTGIQLSQVRIVGVEQRHAILVPDDRRRGCAGYRTGQVRRVVFHHFHRLQPVASNGRGYCNQRHRRNNFRFRFTGLSVELPNLENPYVLLEIRSIVCEKRAFEQETFLFGHLI